MDKLMPLLEKLGNVLGTNTEMLFNTLVKQARISSICDSILLVVILICAIVCCRIAINLTNDDYDVVRIVLFWVSGSLFLVFLIGLFQLDVVIAGFINPEYWALNKILHTLKPPIQ